MTTTLTAATAAHTAFAAPSARAAAGPRVATRLRTVLAVLLTLLAVSTTIGADQAQAWTRAVSQGRPGSLNLPYVRAYDEGQYTTYGPYLAFSSARPTVYRSPATSGAQDVMGLYTIQRWNGSSWSNVTSQRTAAYRIPAGYSYVQLPGVSRAPSTQRGYFRVVWVFAWADARSGASLGSTSIVPAHSGDLRCATTARPCSASAGWVRIGRAYALGGGW